MGSRWDSGRNSSRIQVGVQVGIQVGFRLGFSNVSGGIQVRDSGGKFRYDSGRNSGGIQVSGRIDDGIQVGSIFVTQKECR